MKSCIPTEVRTFDNVGSKKKKAVCLLALPQVFNSSACPCFCYHVINRATVPQQANVCRGNSTQHGEHISHIMILC